MDFVALYNDQGWRSRVWKTVKRTYCRLPGGARWIVLYPCAAWIWGPSMVRDLLRFRPLASWKSYSADRGMSPWRDVVDWVGGYPFETAKPREVTERAERLGFVLEGMRGAGRGYGCNEFLFRRAGPDPGIGTGRGVPGFRPKPTRLGPVKAGPEC